MKILFDPEALIEATESAVFYEQQQPGLGTKGFPSMLVIMPGGSMQKLKLPLNGTNKDMLDAIRFQLEALYKK